MPRQDSRWKSHPALAGAPDPLHPWLTDPASLTARIVARCGHFEVQVLGEYRAVPCFDERGILGLPARRPAWVREVLLVADGAPVVFAHSILAPCDLAGAWQMAQGIGRQPLGAALFADPDIERGPLQAARLTASHPLQRQAAVAVGGPLPPLWARRSRFCRHGRPLLVTEVFLPGIAALEP
jgi:chorismate lyase